MTKLLITGMPQSGKSTLTESIVRSFPRACGFVTTEMREGTPDRTGFEVISSTGARSILAHVDLQSPHRVAEFGVDLPGFESVLPGLFEFGPDDLLYIDEIGQMELFSAEFPKLVRTYLDAPNHFIGSISKIYNDDYLQSLRDDPRIHLIDIDQVGREHAKEQARALFPY